MEYSVQNAVEWSRFLEQVGRRYPEVLEESAWTEKWGEKVLYRSVYDTVVSAENEVSLNRLLRQQRNKQMARIAIRDLTGLAGLNETMIEVSDLADALVSGALDWHYSRFCERYGTPIGGESGQPQKMIVLGMGKLGGQELNFSSDIDLIFAFPEQGQTEGAVRSISNDQFFLRLGQALNKSLVDFTEDGFVYRVDMRLRPFGDAGPLAASFASLEHYYEIHGRAWERYALVKARAMAGDPQEVDYLFSLLRPFVYRRYVDFTAMDSLRELKQMIVAEVKKKGMENNIKLGPGGIREVEFIVQAFQLVHGGRDQGLQGRQLLPMLDRLLERQYLTADDYAGLKSAYVFLRRAENRLQEWNDQQTHDLPKDENQQAFLAASMGFECYAGFYNELAQHRAFVEAQFESVFAVEEVSEAVEGMGAIWLSELESEADLNGLTLDRPDAFIKQLRDFKQGRFVGRLSKEGVERLNAFMPLMLDELFRQGYSEEVLARVLRIVESVVQRSVYLVLLKENPDALKHLVELVEVSSWLTDMLVKYPALLDQLLDERELYSPLDAEHLTKEACLLLEECGLDEEQFMDKLRQWRHAQIFKVAAADVTGQLPVMKVSDYLSWIAEAVLSVTVEFAWRFMQKRSGLPGGLPDGVVRNPFLILGYGKLGGIELGYGSDLDIVFLYEGVPSGAQTINPDGRTLDNAIYFIRMGQKIISLLTTMMPSGKVYEVDTRLRPNGKSGMLVTDLSSFMAYQQNKAWTWEHQALVRARAVAGDGQSVQAYNDFKDAFLQQERDAAEVKEKVVEMRQKMQTSLDKSDAERFDLKQGSGGIVDIEFMMQYLVLSYAHQYPELTKYSDNVRILEAVAQVGLLNVEDVEALTHAYKTYRSKYHRVALANDKPVVEQSCYEEDRANVIRIWQGLMME